MLLFIIIYIISAILMFLHIRLAHYHPKGIFYNLSPTVIDIILVFTPLLNTIGSFYGWLCYFPLKLNLNLSKETDFFRLKTKK